MVVSVIYLCTQMLCFCASVATNFAKGKTQINFEEAFKLLLFIVSLQRRVADKT
jgi:F0F1-type ATP synthase assembly protein I